MRTCAYCKVRYEKGSGITFHKFPTDDTLKLWLKNMKLVNWKPKSSDHLCSKHFTESCFNKHLSRTSLKKCSVPTIFNETNSSLKDTPAQSKDELTDNSQEYITINVDKLNTSSVPLNFNLLDDDKQKIEINKQDTVPRGSGTTQITVQTTNTVQHTPPSTRTLADIRASVLLDHQYTNSPKRTEKELIHVKRALKRSQSRVKVLTQTVKRLTNRVQTLKTVIAKLNRPEAVIDNNVVVILKECGDVKRIVDNKMYDKYG